MYFFKEGFPKIASRNLKAIDGFRQLLRDVAPDAIASVKVTVPPVYAGMIRHKHAGNGRVERITSAAYQLALAAYRPDLLEDVVRPDLSQDAKIAAFMNRVEVAPDPALAPHFPKVYPARIEVTLHGGRNLATLVTDATGDPAKSLDEKAVRGKFERLTQGLIARDAAETLATAALGATTSDAALATLSKAIEASPVLNPGS